MQCGSIGSWSGGTDALRKSLDRIKDVDKNTHIQRGMRQAGGLLASRFRSGILQNYLHHPAKDATRPFSLYQSVHSVPKKGKAGSIRYVGFERSGGFHGALAHLVDGGTLPRYQETTNKYTGIMPATHFARTAFAGAVGGMYERISKGVERALKAEENQTK